MTKEQEEAVRQILAFYGKDEQARVCAEECAELISALSKYHRGRCDEDAVVEEIADVQIMCAQMAECFGYEKVRYAIAYKLARQLKRIERLNKRQRQ